MTNHYYSERPDTAHDFEQWAFELKGRTFQFVTDSGVFSRETVDYGSRVLIDAFDWEELPDEGKILDVGCGYGLWHLRHSGLLNWSTLMNER